MSFEVVRGFCPMGCGQTLVLTDSKVTCRNDDCPSPFKVAAILADAETEHIVDVGEENFTTQHPIRERGTHLWECDLHQRIACMAFPPVAPGRYRVTVESEPDAATAETRRSDYKYGLRFEPILWCTRCEYSSADPIAYGQHLATHLSDG